MHQTYETGDKWSQFNSELMRQGPAIRKAYMSAFIQILKDSGEVEGIDVLEVGSWAGASTITWAQAIKKAGIRGSVHCVDFWRPYFDLEVNQARLYRAMNSAAETGDIFKQFKQNISDAGVEDIVSYTVGDSKDVLPLLQPGRFQVVFIDGSHKYEDVLRDIREAGRLVADGGIVCGDDLEIRVREADPEAHRLALQQGIDFTQDPKTLISYHPGVSQAIADVFDDVSSRDGVWAVRRRGDAWEGVDLEALELLIPEHLRQFEAPAVVYSEYGFNIVKFQGTFATCRQCLGPVDFDAPIEELQQLYSPEDFSIERSLMDARLRICSLEIARLNALVAQYRGQEIATERDALGGNLLKMISLPTKDSYPTTGMESKL